MKDPFLAMQILEAWGVIRVSGFDVLDARKYACQRGQSCLCGFRAAPAFNYVQQATGPLPLHSTCALLHQVLRGPTEEKGGYLASS